MYLGCCIFWNPWFIPLMRAWPEPKRALPRDYSLANSNWNSHSAAISLACSA